MNRKRLIAVGGTLVLAVFLAGHMSTAVCQAPSGAGDAVIAGEGCTVIIVGKDASEALRQSSVRFCERSRTCT